MNCLVPKYSLRTGWGHTVSLKDPNFGHTELGNIVDSDTVGKIIEWVLENSHGVRISYDTWKFNSHRDVEEFIMMYTLRYGK
jgi:hypothetical protein